jgi:hypothetical protein
MKSIKQIMREANIGPDVDKRELTQKLFQTYNEIQNLEKTYKIIAKKFGLQPWEVSDFDKENRIISEVRTFKHLLEDVESDVDSGSGIIMNPNQSELNDSSKASIEYTFTAPDGSKIQVELDPKDYHAMGVSSDPGQATKARFELKVGLGGNISSFRKAVDALVKKGFKVAKEDSTHQEFDPLPDEDKWRYH